MLFMRVGICLLISFGIVFFMSCKNEYPKPSEIGDSLFFKKQNYAYVHVGDSLQMAYVDIGKDNNGVILLLHGEPNYSYVYRNIAPRLVANGYRVIIPDLIGFGYSTKPIHEELISYSNHTKWLSSFIQRLSLDEIYLFAHDWGAMISLRILADQPELFKKAAISYGYLFEGKEAIPESFENFRTYAKSDTTFSAGNIMNWGSNKELADSIRLKYDLPFKTESDYYAVRKFPSLIPTDEHEEEALINQKLNRKLKQFDKPFITIWGNHKDPMWLGKDSVLQAKIPGAKNQEHFTLDSNHFIQEDQPEELTRILLKIFKEN